MSLRDSASPVDIVSLLDEGRWTSFQKWVLCFAALAFGVDGLANQVLGLAVPALMHNWGLHKEAFAPVAAAGLFGVAVGTVIGGVVGDRFGRRGGLIGSVLLFGVMTAATAAVSGVGPMLWLRLAAGLGIGGAIPNGAALIAEFTPLRRRSLAIALGMVFIPVGALLSGIFGTFLMPSVGWQGLFLVCGILPILLGVAFLLVLPESPRYLAHRPHRWQELSDLLARIDRGVGTSATFVENSAGHSRSPLSALFGARMRMDTLALWVAFFFCLLASYSMFSWIPTMLAGQGFSLRQTSIGMTAFNSGGVTGGVLGGWLIGRYGSRSSVLWLSGGGVVGAIALGLIPFNPAHGFSGPVTVLIVEGIFVAALHTGLYTMAAHVYPSFVRATGVGAASAVGRIGAVLSSFTGVLTLQLGGASSYFIVIGGCIAVSLIAITAIRHHIPASLGGADDEALRASPRPSPAGE